MMGESAKETVLMLEFSPGGCETRIILSLHHIKSN